MLTPGVRVGGGCCTPGHGVARVDEAAGQALVVAHPVDLDVERLGAVVLTNRASSSPGTALTWLANPSIACGVWIPVTTQLLVPGLAFSSISHRAVGTTRPRCRAVVWVTAGGGRRP